MVALGRSYRGRHTKYYFPNDLRYYGSNSDITCIKPDGTVTIIPSQNYDEIPKYLKDFSRLRRDLKERSK